MRTFIILAAAAALLTACAGAYVAVDGSAHASDVTRQSEPH